MKGVKKKTFLDNLYRAEDEQNMSMQALPDDTVQVQFNLWTYIYVKYIYGKYRWGRNARNLFLKNE